MKVLGYIIVYLITSLSMAQAVFTEEEVMILNDSIQLPGTLTFDANLETQPLVIIIQGSGNPDRNGNQLQANIKANYLKQLAEALFEKQIAVFRFDKRNVTVVNHKFILKHYEFNDLVNDVDKIISHFKHDSRFSSITILGHSQGSLVGMLALNADVDKYISLSGLGQSADKAMVWQISKQNEGLGQVTEHHFKELRETGTVKEVNPFLISIFSEQNYVFLLSYIKYDPQEIIKAIDIPILILNGDKDIQVTVDDADKLHNANPKSERVIIQNMNHVLKHIEQDTDNMKSYYSSDYPLAKTLVATIEAFIKK